MGARTLPVEPPIDAPDPYRPDVEGLTAYVHGTLANQGPEALAAWVLSFVPRLWKIQGDLLTRVRAATARSSPSERMSALQAVLPTLFAQAANDPNAAVPPPRDKKKRGARTPRPHGRPVLPPELVRVPEVVPVEDARRRCDRCQSAMVPMGFEEHETLELVPAHYVVKKTRREKLSCPCCRSRIVVAEVPDAVVDRGILGDELLVSAMVAHYRDAIPFERIARDAREQGAPVAANTLARSVGKLVDLFDPVVRHIFARCVRSEVVGSDATSMPVLDPDVPGGVRRGTLWNLLGDGRWSYFGYAPSGHDHHLEALLAGCSLDVLMCDGSPTLNVAEKKARVRVGCHAHARSKLVAALRAGDTRAVPALAMYAELFAIEARSKQDADTPAQRDQRRSIESARVMLRLRAWVDARLGDVEPRSALGKAVSYLARQWSRLHVFVHDPRVELTNNAVERELRTWVLARKTWLFCGHEESAKRAAAALTLVMTCRRLGIDVRRYLRDTLRRLLAGEKDASLLWPENYRPSG